MPEVIVPRSLVAAGVIGAVGIVALLALNPFHQVSSGYIGVKTVFGAVQHDQLDPGLHLVMPFVSAIHDVSTQPHKSETDETAATHDQQNVTTRTAVTWDIDPAYADVIYRDYRTLEGLQNVIILPIIANDMKAVISKYDAQELITRRADVASEIATLIGRDMARRHVIVGTGGVNLTNLEFSQEYNRAIEAKQIAQQSALQAKYTLEQTETSSQAQVVQAKAAAAATVATAEGQAKATIVQAQADAEAYKQKNSALTAPLLQLTAIQKWDGVLPHYMGGQTPLPFLSVAGQPIQK